MPKNAVPLYIVLVLSLLDQISAQGDSDKADIVVAFHASSSTSREDFQSLLTFVKGLVSRVDFDEGRARLGVLAYGENPHVQFHLHEYRTWTDVYNAISNINDNVRSNIVDTSGALIESLIMFDYQYTRTDVSKAVFLITDAASTINDNYLSDLTLVMQNENIEVFPIGIGIWDKSELETIATSPKNVYTVSQYSKLQTLTNILRQDVQSLKPRETGYDLVVILDSSVSQEYFDWMTTFTKHLADTICIDDGEFKVGLLRYSTDSNVQFNLKDYQSSGNVRKAVDNVRYQGGITNTAQAIDTARTQMFRPDQGDRDYARNFILLITGQNKSLSTSDAWRAAERAEKDGIQLYVIGLNINDSVELDETSSHPLTTYQYLTKSKRELELVPPQIYADLLRMSKNPPSMRQRPTIPTVRVLSTRYPVKYRTSVTLECVVDSYPPHTKVTWYRVTNGDRTEMEKVTDYCGSTVNVPSLTINRADFYDNGNYVCTAENVAGVGSSEETRVIVSGACGLTKVDIVIILESSASVNDSNFQKMKNFCKDFLKNADLDSGNIQIGIVSYSTGVHIEFQMNDYSTSQDIMEAIDAIPYRNGSKNTADGLRIMRSQMFTAANGDRDGVPNVVLILTDGWSNISSQRTFSEAEQARAKGINIYSIGIGLRDTRELNDMASEPASENSFNIQDFDEFAAVSDQVFQAVCLGKL
ncbi:unnamed protein product [Mytilus coruscus]|uniref:COL6A n=1 Tax=Mytilus coruscus TaxID=42192 RepID=A0A6J8F3I1_MYTCO|nr:unnamed protein product [Mytilus coruscus]